jgi:hypothetical protein
MTTFGARESFHRPLLSHSGVLSRNEGYHPQSFRVTALRAGFTNLRTLNLGIINYFDRRNISLLYGLHFNRFRENCVTAFRAPQAVSCSLHIRATLLTEFHNITSN